MPDFSIEQIAIKKGYKYICGDDEAGRGPLAGPVCAAAVILPKNCEIEGLNDSKKISEKKRELLYDIIIEKAVAYIKENFASDITLSSMAKRFCISPEHFSRMFKKETGLGFSKYLNSLRLQYAEQLLKSTKLHNVTQVAEICGLFEAQALPAET